MSEYMFDVIVIGGGSGGLAFAKRAAAYGKKVAVCDYVKASYQGTKWNLGGTCVNVGCIPKKMMHFASILGELREDQIETGWDVDLEGKHSWETMLKNVNRHVRESQYAAKFDIIGKNIEYYKCLAKFVEPHKLELTNVKGEISHITGQKIVIAVGGRPRNFNHCPGFKEHSITSDDLFWRKSPPGKSLIIGGGYVAMECGGFIKSLGFDVNILVRSKPLAAFDQDMAKRVVKHMEFMGVGFINKYDSGAHQSITKREDGRLDVEVTADGKVVKDVYDSVFVAIGREADVHGLNLAAVGVKWNDHNKIISTPEHGTTAEHIYAIGDCIDVSPELTPVAIMEAHLLADRLYKDSKALMNYDDICTTIFTPLEYSSCGLSGEAAIKKYGDENINQYHTTFNPLEWEYLKTRSANICYVKAVCLATEDNKVLGLHYVGPNAGEIMQGYGVAMKVGFKLKDLQDTVGIHPTSSETFMQLKYTKKEMPEVIKTSC